MSLGFDPLSDGDFVRRQRFRLGEYRRRRYRNRRFLEASSGRESGREPDYVGIGVQRAGTSRWHQLITAHPDVAEVTDPAGRIVKEIHWFDEPLAENLDARDRAYHAWFQAPASQVIGEWTPRYLYDLWPIDRLRQSCPDTKLIIMLRDPIERLRSALQFYEGRGIGIDRDTVRESIWRGMYGPQLTYVFDRWPREQVFVGLFEDGIANPSILLDRLYEFLDLDGSFRPDDLDRLVNQSTPLELAPTVFSSARSLYEADRAEIGEMLPDVDFSAWS